MDVALRTVLDAAREDKQQTGLSRRGFLKLLGMAAPAVVAPKYFLPPIGGWKSDVIASPGLDPIVEWHAHSTVGMLAGIERGAYPGRPRTGGKVEPNNTQFELGRGSGQIYERDGTLLGHAVISHVDVESKTIWFAAPLPKGTRRGSLAIL